MTANDHELLGSFIRDQSQDAFTALVNRHLNLVYSAAVRQVRSPQLAEEVSLSVFTQLARHAAKLAAGTNLTAWLYQVTRNTAIDVIRSEARRQARELTAMQMSALQEPDADWLHVEPLLDEAMQSLDETDRTAVLLRYFENKSLREVGEAIGASEDAAQKRVSRAVERLREYFSKRKVTVGAAGLAALVSTNAVQAAPAGLASTVATGAALASATISASTALTISKTVAMTTMQKAVFGIVMAGAVAAGVYQTYRVSVLKGEIERQKERQAALSSQMEEMARQRDRATNASATLLAENEALKKRPGEVLKLRGEVGRLKQANAEMGSSSPLSKATASPEVRKLLRAQQKLGMGLIYKGFAKQMNLDTNQTDQFNSLLADHIMQNVDHVTTILRDKPGPEKMNEMFAAQDAVLQQQVAALLGPDGAAQYADYSKNLLSTLTAEQFKEMMTGSDAEKTDKANQLRQAMQAQEQAVLASDGLPPDYQTVPILNFRNIASEQDGENSLKMLGEIFDAVAAQAGGYLTPEDLSKFQEFKNTAINNNRAALSMNRTLMAPISN